MLVSVKKKDVVVSVDSDGRQVDVRIECDNSGSYIFTEEVVRIQVTSSSLAGNVKEENPEVA